jgi:hypothetical protein
MAKCIALHGIYQAYCLVRDLRRFRQEHASQNADMNLNNTASSSTKIKNTSSRNSKKD